MNSSVKPTFEDILGKQLHPNALNKANFARQVPLKVEAAEESADEHFLDKTPLISGLKGPSQMRSGAPTGQVKGSALPQSSPIPKGTSAKVGGGAGKSPVKSTKSPALKTPTNGRQPANGPLKGLPKRP